jgi:hypothetical protein
MRKALALFLAVCVGAMGVGCEGEKKPETKVPKSDLGAPATSPTTTPPAGK